MALRRLLVGGVAVATVVAFGAGCGGGGAGPVVITRTESLASENVRKVPTWMQREHLPPRFRQGGLLFAQIGCLNCHGYLGTGGGYKSAPDLTAEGRKHRGIGWQIRHLRCPSCLIRGSPMPQFGALGTRRLHQLAAFLEASKGAR